MEDEALFTGENDGRGVFLSVRAGAGAADDTDWAGMLQSMYTRWLARHEYGFEVLNEVKGETAGIIQCSLHVPVPNAYGRLKGETGVHRLVRQSPFHDSPQRRTTFAAVEVVPECDEKDVDFRKDEIKIEINAAHPAMIRITHLPSGVMAQCGSRRSQTYNRDTAVKEVASRLRFLEKAAREVRIGFGQPVRSWVMHPYERVKDERTGHETGDLRKVLDGDLDPFIDAFLRWKDRKH